MKKRTIALLVTIMSLFNIAMTQDPVVINFSGGEANGSTFIVDVTADNFVDITGMQLYIGWDESVFAEPRRS